MKGIVLAGGSGTRLYPITLGVSKQLLPIYDKPMVYYPISVLMLAGIRDILIISTPNDMDSYKKLLGTGEHIGVNFSYKVQHNPNGLAEAFILGEDFIGDDSVCLILGDNIFWGNAFSPLLQDAAQLTQGAVIFGYEVKDPERFGVINFSNDGKVVDIQEKPQKPKSNIVATGLYFYDNKVVEVAKKVKPSQRGELEITSINEAYLNEKRLDVKILGRGFAWLDTGTVDSLYEASSFVRAIQTQQGYVIACLEEIAFRHGWINRDQLNNQINRVTKSAYGQYISTI